jgi:tetratricopeptide (TPR) repeat protein
VEQILASAPANFDIRMLHGRILRDQRKFPQAAQDFFRAAQTKPDSWEAWSELAGVLVMAEDYPAALGALDRLSALHAEKPGHVYLRAIVLDKINQRKPALESYERFLAMSNGQSPDEEFKARQRIRILQREIRKQ